MSLHRSNASPLKVAAKGVRKGRKSHSGRRSAQGANHRPLRLLVPAYALAALLAVSGGYSIHKGIESQSSEVASSTHKWAGVKIVDLLHSGNPTEVPASLARPEHVDVPAPQVPAPEKEIAPAPAVKNSPAEAAPVEIPSTIGTQAPDLLSVPALGISATIVTSPLRNNALVIPSSQYVGEYTEGTPLTGTEGTTLLVGHVNFPDGSMGAMGPITYAKPGQIINASDGTGRIHAYRIATVATYVKQALPDEVFATTGPRRLVLVTCGGPVINGYYRDNVVVTATPM